jgi:hypothetical protein
VWIIQRLWIIYCRAVVTVQAFGASKLFSDYFALRCVPSTSSCCRSSSIAAARRANIFSRLYTHTRSTFYRLSARTLQLQRWYRRNTSRTLNLLRLLRLLLWLTLLERGKLFLWTLQRIYSRLHSNTHRKRDWRVWLPFFFRALPLVLLFLLNLLLLVLRIPLIFIAIFELVIQY